MAACRASDVRRWQSRVRGAPRDTGRRSKRSDEHRRAGQAGARHLLGAQARAADGTLDRDATDAVLDEINERAVEEALQLKEAHDGSEVTVADDGPGPGHRRDPQGAVDGCGQGGAPVRRGAARLRRGRHRRVLADGDRHGRRASTWCWRATRRPTGARRRCRRWSPSVLGLPALTHAREVTVEGATVTVRRETDDGVTTLTAELPAVVSVGEKINEPRYPSFKGIMAAKKKPVTTLTLADAGHRRRARSGWPARSRSVTSARRRSRPRARARRSTTRATAARRSPRSWSPRS